MPPRNGTAADAKKYVKDVKIKATKKKNTEAGPSESLLNARRADKENKQLIKEEAKAKKLRAAAKKTKTATKSPHDTTPVKTKTKVKAKNTKASQEPVGAAWGGSPHERNQDSTTKTPTSTGAGMSGAGAYYPTGKDKTLSLPTSKLGMLGAAVNPMGAIVKGAGSVALNQVNYGMNDKANTLYQQLVQDPANAGMSTKDLVNMARKPQMDNQLDHAFIGTPTTDNQRAAVAAGTVSPTGGLLTGQNQGNQGNQGGSQAPADPTAPAAPELGQLPTTDFQSFTERPDWAPSLGQPQGPSVQPDWAPQQQTPYGQQNQGNNPMVDNNNRLFESRNGMNEPSYTADQQTQDQMGKMRDFLGYGAGANNPQYGMDNGRQFATTGMGPQQQDWARMQGMQNEMNGQVPTPRSEQEIADRGRQQQSLLSNTPQQVADTLPIPPQGPRVPEGNPDSGTFKPVTFRSGAGTSTTTEDGMTTELSAPYSGLSGLVGDSTGLMGEAAGLAQQAPNQVDTSFDTGARSQELFDQRSDLLKPAFAQQNTKAKESMFGAGRLGLRLAGEGAGTGADGGMVSPDALGVSQAQSQALAGLASQSTTDAFNEGMQRSGMGLNQFNTNQAQNQQQYNNLQGSASGMLNAGMQGATLEQNLAQQQLDQQRLSQEYGQNQQNFGLAQQNFGLAQQSQDQNYGLASQGQGFNQGMANQNFGLAQQGQNQNYALAQQGQGFNQGMANQNFGLAAQGQGFNQGLANQNLGLAAQNQGFNQGMAQQNYGLAAQGQGFDQGMMQQNFGLAAQGQGFDQGIMQNQQNMDYGFGQQKMDLATQQQLQDYEMGMLRGNQDYGLRRDVAAQNYELGTEQNAISRMTGQAQANAANYQPDPWLSAGVGLGTAYLGTTAGSNWLSGVGTGVSNWWENL